MNAIFQTIAQYAKDYPEGVAVVLGYIASWSASGFLEAFTPLTWSIRLQRQLALLTNFLVGTVVSATIWNALTPKDPSRLNLAISLVTGLSSPWAYIYVSRAAGHFLPWLTAYKKPPTTDPPTPAEPPVVESP